MYGRKCCGYDLIDKRLPFYSTNAFFCNTKHFDFYENQKGKRQSFIDP